jgi:hypothetical protein
MLRWLGTAVLLLGLAACGGDSSAHGAAPAPGPSASASYDSRLDLDEPATPAFHGRRTTTKQAERFMRYVVARYTYALRSGWVDGLYHPFHCELCTRIRNDLATYRDLDQVVESTPLELRGLRLVLGPRRRHGFTYWDFAFDLHVDHLVVRDADGKVLEERDDIDSSNVVILATVFDTLEVVGWRVLQGELPGARCTCARSA